MAKQAPPTVIEFKVALKNRKSIWRRIATRSNQTLEQLHWAIYDAFDRDDEHLYSFYFPRPGARGREIFRNSDEYTHPAVVEDPSLFGSDAGNAAKTKLGTLSLQVGQTFLYLFDFGDEWWHEIKVASVDGPVEKGKYPRIVERRGDSPPHYPDIDDE